MHPWGVPFWAFLCQCQPKWTFPRGPYADDLAGTNCLPRDELVQPLRKPLELLQQLMVIVARKKCASSWPTDIEGAEKQRKCHHEPRLYCLLGSFVRVAMNRLWFVA